MPLWLRDRDRSLLPRGRPAGVERRFRIRGDLQVGAVVVVVTAVLVEPVLRHELHDLQRALPAADVGQLDVGFERIGRLRRVNEQAVGQHRSLCRRNRGGYRPRPALGVPRDDVGVCREIGAVDCKGDAVVAWMEDRFHQLDVQLRVALHAPDRVGGHAGVGRCAAARAELLRIAELVLDEPRSRFDQREVRLDERRHEQGERRRGHQALHQVFHAVMIPP